MIEFFVPGVPKPAGSKRAFRNAKTGRIIVTDDCKKGKDWRGDVRFVATTAVGDDASPLDGPLYLYVDFHMPRPKGHFGRNGVKASAPAYPTSKPDATKLLRCIEDALTGILWRDDAQIVMQSVSKIYADKQPGARVRVGRMEQSA